MMSPSSLMVLLSSMLSLMISSSSPPVLVDIVVVVARRRLFGFGGGRGGLLEWLRTWSFGIHPPTATSTLVSALGNYLAVVGAGRVAVK
jgi:hypothetical protein